ncbi:MAG: S1 RNA-binding domain-containing protein [Erysipelotrichaceae bacterium]|nr:S1 RNA-binding domain-containing protein [Erysipelotrichaceae bacterium]
MNGIKVGEIIKVQVIGFQNYGIFIKSFDDEEYTGLIHISEISNDFVKDVTKVAHLGDILYAKVLDVEEKVKHIKLSIKATQPKMRYRSNYIKQRHNPLYKDFTSLQENLDGWIKQELKEKNRND